MITPAPTWSRGSRAYLIESAAIGYLEVVVITGITLASNGNWLYSYSQSIKNQQAATYGDRRSLANGLVIWLDESELTDYCTALGIVKTCLQTRINEINALQSSCI